jgi:hypothetical protein
MTDARTPFAAILVSLGALAGCRSPFEPVKDEPDDWRVGRGVHAWPLFERAPGEKETRTDVLWPLASLRSDADGALTSAEFVYPVFHYLDTPERSEYAVRPLFSTASEPPRETEPDGTLEFGAVFELFKWKDSKAETIRRAAIVESRKTRTTERFHVFPVVWHGTNGDEEWTHVWPLYGENKEGTFQKHWTLAPFFSIESDPAKDAHGWDAFWPFFHYDREKEATHVRALPLLWHDFAPDAETTVVFPLWWDFEDKDSKFQLLFPFYGRQTRGETFERTAYGPLWIDTRDGTRRSTDLVWPLVGWSKDEDPSKWAWHVFPVLWFGQDGESESYSHVFPLFGSWKSDDESGWYAPAGIVIHEEDATSSSWNFLGPVLHLKTSENGHETGVFPLFTDERHGDHSQTGLLLNILANWESREEAQTREGDVLFGLLAHWESDGQEKTDAWRVLWRLVHSSTTEHKTTFAVNPLFRHETNDRGDDYWSVLFGLVARKQEAGETSWRFLWVL